MSHTESKPTGQAAVLAQYRAESAQRNRQELAEIQERLARRYDDIGSCYETSLRLVRCARAAALTEQVTDDDAAGIVEVLSEAEDIMMIGYLRHLLRDE